MKSKSWEAKGRSEKLAIGVEGLGGGQCRGVREKKAEELTGK